MNKKILSTMLAGVCALSCMSLSSFAAEDALKATTATYSISAGVQTPTMDVTLPNTSTVAAVLNPFGLNVYFTKDGTLAADQSEQPENGSTVTDKIASPAYTITSKTPCALDIEVTASATAAGEAKIVKTAISAESTSKDVLLFVKADETVAHTGALTGESGAAGKNELVIGTTAATKVIGQVAKSDGTSKTAQFIVDGDLNTNTKAAWTEKDKVTIKLILNLNPATPEAEADE